MKKTIYCEEGWETGDPCMHLSYYRTCSNCPYWIKNGKEVIMAKTIKEMGKEHLKEKGYILTTNNGEHMAEIEAAKMFEAGAKAVLEEIEKIVNNRNWVAFPKASISELREKIKKLKGE